MVRLRFYPKRRVAAGRQRAGRAGMTMVEVLVAAMIGVILSAALMSFAVYMAKLSKSTRPWWYRSTPLNWCRS